MKLSMEIKNKLIANLHQHTETLFNEVQNLKDNEPFDLKKGLELEGLYLLVFPDGTTTFDYGDHGEENAIALGVYLFDFKSKEELRTALRRAFIKLPVKK